MSQKIKVNLEKLKNYTFVNTALKSNKINIELVISFLKCSVKWNISI